MKIVVHSEEWYPVHFFSTEAESFNGTDMTGYTKDPRIEVPNETVERWNRVFAEFDAVQKEIEAIDDAYWNGAGS